MAGVVLHLFLSILGAVLFLMLCCFELGCLPLCGDLSWESPVWASLVTADPVSAFCQRSLPCQAGTVHLWQGAVHPATIRWQCAPGLCRMSPFFLLKARQMALELHSSIEAGEGKYQGLLQVGEGLFPSQVPAAFPRCGPHSIGLMVLETCFYTLGGCHDVSVQDGCSAGVPPEVCRAA